MRRKSNPIKYKLNLHVTRVEGTASDWYFCTAVSQNQLNIGSGTGLSGVMRQPQAISYQHQILSVFLEFRGG